MQGKRAKTEGKRAKTGRSSGALWLRSAPAALALAALALAALALAPGARAQTSFCLPAGSGAGECDDPRGVAVDEEAGLVFVTERQNDRVSVFEEDGSFVAAFGWGVNAEEPKAELQTCTAASGCLAGEGGAGAGQFSGPRAVAVDDSGAAPHAIYVGTDNRRVQKFHLQGGEAVFDLAFGWGVNAEEPKAELQTCTAESGCRAGEATGPEPQECQISFVEDTLATGPEGHLYVADTHGSEPVFTGRVQEFGPAGECLGQTPIFAAVNKVLKSIAVDAAGDAFLVISREGGALRKYDLETGTELCGEGGEGLEPGIQSNGLAVDGEGRLLASQREPTVSGFGTWHAVTAYDAASCARLARFGYGQIEENLFGLAGGAGAAEVFGSELNGAEAVLGLEIPPIPPGPIVVPASVEVTAPGAVRAEIGAEVNPEDEETEVRIQYVDQQGYEEDLAEGGDGFEGPSAGEGPPTVVPAGFSVAAVEALAGCVEPAEGGCLEGGKTYRFRVLASNLSGTDVVEGEPFEPSRHLVAHWAQGLGTGSATLAVQANPWAVATAAHFEYLPLSRYEENEEAELDPFAGATRVPAAGELDLGEGEGATIRRAQLPPLAEGTAYRYRVVVSGPVNTEASEAGAFTTQRREPPASCPNDAFRAGPAAFLPDCRAYELVSPVDKEGGDIVMFGNAAKTNQSAVSGGRFTYGSYRAFGDAQAGPGFSQYLAARGAAGWQSHAITPAAGRLLLDGINPDTEYRAFSEDLCEGWVRPLFEPPHSADAIPGYYNLYRRTDELCGGPSFAAITTAAPENLPPNAELKVPSGFYNFEFQGLSADGQTAAFTANESLEGTGAAQQPFFNCNPRLGQYNCELHTYVKGPEGLRYACVLPNGDLYEYDCSAGTGPGFVLFGKNVEASVANALSADGERLYWSTENAEGRIYLRERPLAEQSEVAGGVCTEPEKACTLEVSRAGEEASGTVRQGSRFWAAAADGSRALYTTEGPGVSDLYEFVREGEQTNPIAGQVRGLVGTSEDATRVYFASEEAIAGAGENSEGAEAVEGQPNLYLHEAAEGGSFTFIGTLAAHDVAMRGAGLSGDGDSSATAPQPRFHNGRVGADGLHAAFMSRAPLTGYDNTGAESGEAVDEVFVYDAEAEELLCASCDPSGARPRGGARVPAYQNTLYTARLLSPDGARLFFESADSLVARDTNGRVDVYQWERAGKGGCAETDVTYSAAAAGCIELISSGQSAADAELLDASADGEDVFFTTVAGLASNDPGLRDVYDARVGGGFAAPEPPAPECEGEACQSPAAAPRAPSPSSLGYAGPGDLAAPSASPSARCARAGRRARRLSARAKRLHGAARRSGAPAARRKRTRAARRSAKAARRLSRNAKRCRARARAARRSQR